LSFAVRAEDINNLFTKDIKKIVESREFENVIYNPKERFQGLCDTAMA